MDGKKGNRASRRRPALPSQPRRPRPTKHTGLTPGKRATKIQGGRCPFVGHSRYLPGPADARPSCFALVKGEKLDSSADPGLGFHEAAASSCQTQLALSQAMRAVILLPSGFGDGKCRSGAAARNDGRSAVNAREGWDVQSSGRAGAQREPGDRLQFSERKST